MKARFKECRIAAGLTQKEVASALQISVQAVSYWESGSRKPSHDNCLSLASLYNVSIDYLLGRDEDTEQTFTVSDKYAGPILNGRDMQSVITYPGALKHGKTEFYDPPTNIHRWKSAVQIANSENYSESHGENSGITYNRPVYNTPEASRFANGSGMNHETPLDAAPDQMTIEERFYRLSPERRKQAIDFLNFLEMQDEEE